MDDYLELQGHWTDPQTASELRLSAAKALEQPRYIAAALNSLGSVYVD